MAPRPLLLPLLGLLSLLATPAAGVPDKDCPEYLRRSGNANDLASLSYEVSQPPKPLQLICGGYTPLETVRRRNERTGDLGCMLRSIEGPIDRSIRSIG